MESAGNRVLLGAGCILIASLSFAVMGGLVKQISGSLPNEMVVFFRNVCALVIIVPIVLLRGGFGIVRTRRLPLHLLRTAAGLGAMYCYFHALSRMKLAEAVLLSYTTPLFIPLIARVWLGEQVPRAVRAAVLVGFAGIILILRPGFGIFRPVALVGLAAGVLASLAMVTIRRMSDTEPALRIVFYYTLLCTIISSVPLLWAWQSPDPAVWGLLLLTGLVAVCGQMFMTNGYGLAPAATVGPYVYSTPVFAALLGYVFWGEALDLCTLCGAGLVCVAGILASIRTVR